MNFDRETITLILIVGVALLIVVQWVCWIFEIGRFKPKQLETLSINGTPVNTNIRYVLANFLVNIVNDFRHLLALIIVSVFAFALFAVIYKDPPGGISTAMQSVSSTFGGLIGAIIGFYFGEKTGSREDQNSTSSSGIEEQSELFDQQEIVPIPEPRQEERDS
jgi:hypothetical protein